MAFRAHPTKSDLVLRDLDTLRAINARSRAIVSFTVTTGDALARIVEPERLPVRPAGGTMNLGAAGHRPA